jgi:imidazole glycerol-phosphate synthase subunit HisH
MISIIDYKAGNLASVSNALDRLGAEHRVTFDPAELDASEAVIFPGVGHAQAAMQALRERGLVEWLQQTKKPLLGICLGMQLLYESSEEGDTAGLGLLPGRLKKFDASMVKVPHLGWNDFHLVHAHPILNGLPRQSTFYYVHSYYAPVTEHTLASCSYQEPFAAVAGCDNVLGVQFHPEKSGRNGEILLSNFIQLIREAQ